MNKITIIILLTYLTFICTDTNQSENTIAKIESLRAENDGLRKIVADIETKYVFDVSRFEKSRRKLNFKTYKIFLAYKVFENKNNAAAKTAPIIGPTIGIQL